MSGRELAFGTNLKALRKKAGYTRLQLAELVSYSPKSIEKWESGASLPTISTICALSDIFNVTVDILLYSQKTEIKYLLGIDGGGTKTEFLLTDMGGTEINRLVLGPSNCVDIGMDNAFKLLEEGISRVCGTIDRQEISAFAGLAGGLNAENKRRIGKFLSGFAFGKFANDADTENALEIALNGEDGMAVIMGTGIIAITQINGERRNICGWGYLIDRGGSGYNFGADAFEAAYRSLDGRGGSQMLHDIIRSRTGTALPDLIPTIYSGGKAYIASFADTVFQAFERGDAVAKKIIDRNISEVCTMIRAGQSLFGTTPVKTVICGGLCKRRDVLTPFFKKHLESSRIPEFNERPIVDGAVSLARKLAKGD